MIFTFKIIYFGVYIRSTDFSVFWVAWLQSELKRVKSNFCRQCGARYDYQTCVEWEASEVEIKDRHTSPNSAKQQVIGIRVEHVDFICTCARCGNEGFLLVSIKREKYTIMFQLKIEKIFQGISYLRHK